MNRTTIVDETAYLIHQPTLSMSQKLANFGVNWLKPGHQEQQSLESIRERILVELDGRDGCMESVSERVVRAQDITDLWFLRCALSAALTVDRGADAASASMQTITHLFNGLMTKPMRERRSVLNH